MGAALPVLAATAGTAAVLRATAPRPPDPSGAIQQQTAAIEAGQAQAAQVQEQQQAELAQAETRRRRQVRGALAQRPSLFDILGAGQQRSTLG